MAVFCVLYIPCTGIARNDTASSSISSSTSSSVIEGGAAQHRSLTPAFPTLVPLSNLTRGKLRDEYSPLLLACQTKYGQLVSLK